MRDADKIPSLAQAPRWPLRSTQTASMATAMFEPEGPRVCVEDADAYTSVLRTNAQRLIYYVEGLLSVREWPIWAPNLLREAALMVDMMEHRIREAREAENASDEARKARRRQNRKGKAPKGRA